MVAPRGLRMMKALRRVRGAGRCRRTSQSGATTSETAMDDSLPQIVAPSAAPPAQGEKKERRTLVRICSVVLKKVPRTEI